MLQPPFGSALSVHEKNGRLLIFHGFHVVAISACVLDDLWSMGGTNIIVHYSRQFLGHSVLHDHLVHCMWPMFCISVFLCGAFDRCTYSIFSRCSISFAVSTFHLYALGICGCRWIIRIETSNCRTVHLLLAVFCVVGNVSPIGFIVYV